MNAVSHGLWAKDILVGTETAEDWECFREGILSSWYPCNAMENELAEQITALMWRSRRVIRYETGVTVSAMTRAAEQARKPPAPTASEAGGEEPPAEIVKD